MPKDIPKWSLAIASLRSRAGLSQNEFGDRIGVSQQAVALYESGKKEPGPRTYDRLIELAGTGKERDDLLRRVLELRPGLGELTDDLRARKPWIAADHPPKRPETIYVPLMRDSAAAGLAREIRDNEIEDWLPFSPKLAPRPGAARCVRLEGDSMSPILESGYIVAIDTSDKDHKKLLKHMVAAKDPNGGVTIKWLRRSAGEYLLVPQHISIDHQPIIMAEEGWAIIGKVIWWIGTPPAPK